MTLQHINFLKIKEASLLLLVALLGCSSSDPNGTPGNLPPSDLFGYVKDTSGNALQGVVVSDGYTCTATDAMGCYSLSRHPSAFYVYYSAPADCKIEVSPSTGLPLFHHKLLKSQSQYDFSLTPQPKENRFRILALGDPQVTTANDIHRFTTEAIADIRDFVTAKKGDMPTYAITLGDIVGNKWALFADMVSAMSQNKTGIPVFQTIGNHDHEYPTTSNIAAQRTYESHFGPVNYSFTRGDVHFISMDDIIHDATGSENYKGGFLDWQYEWLKQNLSYVPKDKTVILCVHIPFRDKFTGGTGVYYNEVLELLAEYKHARIFAAHTHSNNNANYRHVGGKIREHITGTTCGAWWRGIICADGTPNGYGVYEFEGSEVTNGIYKPIRYDAQFQIRLYNASDTFSGGGSTSYKFATTGAQQVVANIWNVNDGWSFEVYENGVKSSSSLIQKTMSDVWAKAFFYGFCKETSTSYGNNYPHLYYYTRTQAGSTVRVVAIDEYGNRFEQSEITSPTYYPNTY